MASWNVHTSGRAGIDTRWKEDTADLVNSWGPVYSIRLAMGSASKISLLAMGGQSE